MSVSVTWSAAPLWALGVERREVVEPGELADRVVHYSIPSVDAYGTGQEEEAELIRSAKLTLRGGEVLISKLNPRKSRVLIVRKSLLPMVSSTEFVGIEPSRRLDARFLAYYLRSESTRQELDSQVQSVTRSHQRVSPEDIMHLKVHSPPLEEQRRIADFLDAETARIDRMRTAVERLQEVLEERRAAQRSVTLRGENSSGKRVTHPVIGELPSHWEVLPLKRLVPRVGVGVVVDPSSYFVDEGVPFLRGVNVTDAGIDLTEVRFMSEKDSAILWRSRLNAGDVVVVRVGDPGLAAVVPDNLEGANCASILVVKRGERLVPDYLEAYFNSPLGGAFVDSYRYGAAQGVINVSHIVNFMVPVPELGEQKEILAELERNERPVRELEAKLSQQLRLLSERRQALITAAVTGEFDVSAASGRGIEE